MEEENKLVLSEDSDESENQLQLSETSSESSVGANTKTIQKIRRRRSNGSGSSTSSKKRLSRHEKEKKLLAMTEIVQFFTQTCPTPHSYCDGNCRGNIHIRLTALTSQSTATPISEVTIRTYLLFLLLPEMHKIIVANTSILSKAAGEHAV